MANDAWPTTGERELREMHESNGAFRERARVLRIIRVTASRWSTDAVTTEVLACLRNEIEGITCDE